MFFRHAKEPKRRHRDSRFKQSFAFRSLCFRRCCLYAANSGTEQLAVRVYRTTLLSQRSNKLRSFSSFAANNNSRSYSAVFRRLLLLMFFIAKVIRRQRRNPAPLKIEWDTERVKGHCAKIRANEWAGIYSRTQRVQPNLREASMFEVDNACCSQPALRATYCCKHCLLNCV